MEGRRRDVDGGVARPALWCHGDHRSRVGHGGRQTPSAPEDLGRPLTGKAVVRPGQAARRGSQARNRCRAGRTSDPLVGQAGPRARHRRTQSVRRAGGRLLRQALPPLRRSASQPDRRPARRPLRGREELADRPGQPTAGRADAVRPAHGGRSGRSLQERRHRRIRPPATRGPGRGHASKPTDRGRPRRHELSGRWCGGRRTRRPGSALTGGRPQDRLRRQGPRLRRRADRAEPQPRKDPARSE